MGILDLLNSLLPKKESNPVPVLPAPQPQLPIYTQPASAPLDYAAVQNQIGNGLEVVDPGRYITPLSLRQPIYEKPKFMEYLKPYYE